MSQLEYLLQLVIACVCGCVIGFERKNRLKEAGIRTHIIVSLGAALIMIVSKYGFTDAAGTFDPSRIAAQIVSGIGFLGAGMIFVRKQAVSGLTTAAGVWTTAGIGMAIGARLYLIGIAATVLVLLVQVILHRNFRWFHIPVTEQLNITFCEDTHSLAFIQEALLGQHVEIINLKAEKLGNGYLEVELYIKLPPNYDASQLINLIRENKNVKAIEF